MGQRAARAARGRRDARAGGAGAGAIERRLQPTRRRLQPARGGYGGLDRRPTLGGGYSRPSVSGSSGFSASHSYGGDRAISRRSSGQALQDYRASQVPPPSAASRYPSTGGGWSPAAPSRRPEPSGWGGVRPRFGAWDAVLAWSLLSSLSRPGNAAYFQDNRNSPGYQEWRGEAERRAAGDPAVAQKLAELDALMTQAKAQPSSAHGGPTESSGAGIVWIVVIIGGAVLVGLWVMRRRLAPAGGGAGTVAPPPPGLGGSAASRFRVGMTIPLDQSPFLLAAGSTKVKPPPESGGMISIEAVGLVSDGLAALHRLYLPGRELFFQLHLGPDGTPDECRYFSLLDQITPSSAEDWGFWLDPAQGMIGWPQFQTKDNKVYDRVWGPGASRVPPRQQEETVQDLNGATQRKLQAMLYGAPTGAAPPAPETEYVLVCAVEQGGQAWVEVHAGIDINPASLTLPAVPLSS